MKDSFEITYDLDRGTYAAVIRQRIFRRPRFFLRLGICVVIGLGLGLNGKPLQGLAMAAGLTIFSVIIWWIAPNRWLSVNLYLLERKTCTFSPDTIGLSTATVKSEVPWAYFLCWDENAGFFTLDLTPFGFCSVIPKSAMADEQQQLFREWAAAKLPKHH